MAIFAHAFWSSLSPAWLPACSLPWQYSSILHASICDRVSCIILSMFVKFPTSQGWKVSRRSKHTKHMCNFLLLFATKANMSFSHWSCLLVFYSSILHASICDRVSCIVLSMFVKFPTSQGWKVSRKSKHTKHMCNFLLLFATKANGYFFKLVYTKTVKMRYCTINAK